MGLDEMYFNRSHNPDKPEWITVRGSSKLEGYDPHLHACLPGTNYSPALAVTLFNFVWNYKRSVRNGGAEDHNFYDLWLLERMQQVCQGMGWEYELPVWTPAPASTHERFGLEFFSDSAHKALALAETLRSGTASEPLSEADEELLALNTSTAVRFLGKQCTAVPFRTLGAL